MAEPNGRCGLTRVIILFLSVISLFEKVETDSRSLFNNYAAVHPFIHTRHKRELYTKKVSNPDNLRLSFVAFNKTFQFELFMNKDLLPINYFEKHHENGENVIHRPMHKERSHGHYKGYIEGFNNSWAAISVHHGISGVFHADDEFYYIEPPDLISEFGHHFIFKASDMKPKNLKCGTNEDFQYKSSVMNDLHRQKRSALLKGSYKSTRKSRYIELVIVNDYLEYKKFNRSKEVVFERSKVIANIVNGLYAPLNIFIALVGVIVWSERDEIKLSTDGDVTLTNFLHYRQQRLAQEHPNDNAQLITAMVFDHSVVGKAMKGQVCTFRYSGGVNMDHDNLVGLVATTITHEIGHGLGMEHDTHECQCPDDKCIMSPSSSSTSPINWSSCSLEYLDLAYSQGMDYCLTNKPTHIIGPVCGNGFLEEGEECDCGLKDFCDNHCCNATSCKLFSNATCATGECCDIETCEIKKTATICRPAASECDLPEYCDGVSEFCQSDTFCQNGEPCGNQKAFCYDGKCMSHADQCKLLWGETGKMSDPACYGQNFKGNVNGNCGYNWINSSYKACNKEDVLCGMLHCAYLNEKLAFGMESAATLIRSYVNVKGKVFICRSAIVDFGLYNTDPGLVPNGAKCGEGKICVDQKCVLVDAIKEVKCPHQCSGNGICNNKGHCHCARGFAPPYCNTTGPGGSIDSGPASDPGVGYVLVVVLYVIFLGFIPLVVIAAGAIYYFRPYFKAWWIAKARNSSMKSRSKQLGTRRPHLPSKFNFDRNSLRALEISAPIQQGSSISNPLGPALSEKEKHTAFKIETSTTVPENSSDLSQVDRPVPVRPAPPRPDAIPQRTPSWTPATAVMLRTVARTSSLRTPNSSGISGRPLSTSMSRPNCPPPRPPLPKLNNAAPVKQNTMCVSSENPNDVERSITPNSMYYDDCQTLDFSDTPLAFVHQSHTRDKQVEPSASSQTSQYSSVGEGRPIMLNQKQIADKTNSKTKNNSTSFPKCMLHCSNERTRQPSLVAAIAKKFEKQNSNTCGETTKSIQMRPPFKSRPLPPTPANPKA